jgi:alkanesulfonate monooxygenase SsuD/methylene tetrahydromethanopterin reductase-like flavin-dependent oxidoreductase (luciferase family)
MALADVSIGVAGALGPDAIARLAVIVERCGFRSLWVNDTPGGDSLAALAAAAEGTSRLVLATGVIPVDRRHADEVVDAVHMAELPEHRLVLGIGAGGTRKGALSLVGSAAEQLRDGTRATVLVGALGPKMRELGARQADGVLLSWLTPDVARDQAEAAHALAAGAQASDSRVALYVRTALTAEAGGRLAEEARRYAGYPAYAANFARLGIRAEDTVLDHDTFADRIPRYRDAVDEVVLRVIAPTDSVDDHVRFVERAGELLER